MAELARAARREKQSQQLTPGWEWTPHCPLSVGGRQESAEPEPTQGRAETSSEAAAVHLSQQICSFLVSSPLVFSTREAVLRLWQREGVLLTVYPHPVLRVWHSAGAR